MNILNQLKSFFTAPPDPKTLWLYVKCKRCGTPVAVRVNLYNDASADWDSGGYVLYKEIMDDKCFTLMRAEIRLDGKYQIVTQKIEQGEFISASEYQALAQTK